MFEDYLDIYSYREVPIGVYTMMQFLDFSYHIDSRIYYFDIDKNLIYVDQIGLITFDDFIKTFRLIFG